MSIFSNDGLWPTPESLALKLLEPHKNLLAGRCYVLDPSAGKGDLLAAVKQRAVRLVRNGKYEYEEHHHDVQLYACEIAPELRDVLRGQGYTVLADDFLAYEPSIGFDLIVMNPPFVEAERHLMRAWHILRKGCIAALVPARIFNGENNVYAHTIRGLVDAHGSVEMLGAAFASAERPTREPVALVRLEKRAEAPELEFDVRNDRDTLDSVEEADTEIALTGFIDNLLATYTAILDAWEAFYRADRLLRKRLKGFGRQYANDGKFVEVARQGYNQFAERVTAEAWSKVFEHPGLQRLLTARSRAMLTEFRETQVRLDFNAHNIEAFLTALVARQPDILKGAVLDAFDTLTSYHIDNTEHLEGWKTNNAYRVRRKFILPNLVQPSVFRHRGAEDVTLRVSADYNGQYTDIDRAMCVVSGRNFDSIVTILSALHAALSDDAKNGGKCYSTFFEIRYYKKGTCHLKFLDVGVWEAFNMAVARARNWLPAAVDHGTAYDGQKYAPQEVS